MDFNVLIAYLGEVIGDQSIALDADRHIALAFGDVVVHLQEIPERSLYFAYADIGELPQEGREALLMQVLKANWTYRGTSCSSLAVNSENDKLAINHYWRTEAMTPDRFIQTLNDFLQVIQDWRGILQDYRPEEGQAKSEDAPMNISAASGEVRFFL